MIEESGRVVATETGSVWVETVRTAACDTCSAKSGCGHSTLAKLGRDSVHMHARCDIDVAIGDQVVVGVPEEIMVKSSLLAYLMPLVAMLIGVLVADELWGQDIFTALAGMAGLGLGFGLLRWHFHRNQHDERYQPVVLRRLCAGPVTD
jgi:sigma-E factor negative regulatory protein RseC